MSERPKIYDELSGSKFIPSLKPLEGDPTYTSLDQRVGLALFDPEFRKLQLARFNDLMSQPER